MLGNLLKSPRLTSFLLPGILDKFERKKRPAKGWTCFIQSADAFKLGTVLGISAPERAYFVNLVLENSARGIGLKRFFRSQLQVIAKAHFSYSQNRALTAIFENSLLWEVFSLVGIDDFRPDSVWIAKKLKNPNATPAAVSQSIERLLEMGAIKKEADGSLSALDIVIPRKFSPTKAYMTALERTHDHLSRGLADQSYFDSLCLITNQEQYSEIRAILEDTKRKIAEVVCEKGPPKTHIAYFNASLFLASN